MVVILNGKCASATNKLCGRSFYNKKALPSPQSTNFLGHPKKLNWLSFKASLSLIQSSYWNIYFWRVRGFKKVDSPLFCVRAGWSWKKKVKKVFPASHSSERYLWVISVAEKFAFFERKPTSFLLRMFPLLIGSIGITGDIPPSERASCTGFNSTNSNFLRAPILLSKLFLRCLLSWPCWATERLKRAKGYS